MPVIVMYMQKFQKVGHLVSTFYSKSNESFPQWMWKNHIPFVVKFAEELADKYQANSDLAVAGAYLHDFGDAFVHRHAGEHAQISEQESKKVLQEAGYTQEETRVLLEEIVAPHSCKAGQLPTTIEGKVLATADALAHLTTDFYLQFALMHLPENKTYPEFKAWVNEKLDRDFKVKIFFEDVRSQITPRYDALKEVFKN